VEDKMGLLVDAAAIAEPTALCHDKDGGISILVL
jgi:hypothetical protein